MQLAERWGEELRERPRGLAEGEPGGRAVISSDDSSGTSPRAFLERILSPRTAFSCQCRRDASHSQSANRLIVGERLNDRWKDLGDTLDNWKI